MKRTLMFGLILFLLVALTFAGEPFKKEFKISKEKTLEVNMKSGGSLKVSGKAGNQKMITVYGQDGAADDWKIKVDRSGDAIELEVLATGSRHGKGPKLEVIVPARFNLKLKTSGGAVEIDHVEGEISGKTLGGELDFSHLKGHIDFKTLGGGITLKESDVDGRLTTMGGRVLLENVVGDVDATSMGGQVIYKNVKSRSGEGNGKVVRIKTMGGAIDVAEAAHGADLHTMGGDITIKSAQEFVTAKTMGGDIAIEAIDGWVKATTMGGDIKVNMTGNPKKGKRDVELKSMGGDIHLTVPAGLSMDIEIQLTLTPRAKKEYKIISDFEIKQEKKTKDGKTIIYGTGSIGGGKHKIKIKTVNGNIILKKSK
jgi:DUF4097 and DUF4098 domain-containing protein YvlB